MPTLTIDHLNKSFGETQALRDMTFSVGEGEIFGFVGSNGAGKSTEHGLPDFSSDRKSAV